MGSVETPTEGIVYETDEGTTRLHVFEDRVEEWMLVGGSWEWIKTYEARENPNAHLGPSV